MRLLNSALKSSISFPYATALLAHCGAVKLGTIGEVYVANNIITQYSRCGELGVAHNLFDEMSHRDTVSWNSMIAGYVNCGQSLTAWELLGDMRRDGFVVDGYTFGSILKGVAHLGELGFGRQVHSMVIKTGFEANVFVGSALVDMYSKCGRVDFAHMVLNQMPECNSVCWNALIKGYVEEGDRETALELFRCMQEEGVKIDDGTLSPLVTLLDDPKFYAFTTQIHSMVIKCGLALNNNVSNAIMTSYSECGSLQEAEKVFHSAVGIYDIVTWNSMLAAYLAHNELGLGFGLFVRLLETEFEPDVYSYTSLISSCFENTLEQQGRALHGLVIKKGMEDSTAISNSLIAMYLKSNGKWMDDALKLFETMGFKDPVSWNSILKGYSQFGSSEDALKLFRLMLMTDVMIDHYSFSAALKSCADLATLQLGQEIHVLAIKSGWQLSDHVTSSLITMYSKCGLIEDSRKSFEDGSKETSITWNFIIFAYAQHGQGRVALELFKRMRDYKVKLDHVTFVAVLTACSHTGLVEEGRHFLNCMESEYEIALRMEHYACGVDLFGRAGLLDEAKSLIESMPFEPDAMLWKTLLGSCRNCGDVELANQIASHLLELEPEEHCTYVLLSDIYGRMKRWGEKAGLAKMMRERGVKKVPGWSWIEIEKKMNAFNAEDYDHPNSEQIYEVLGLLMDEAQMMNHDLDLDVLVDGVDDVSECSLQC